MSLLRSKTVSQVARRFYYGRKQIGNREVVGFGINGTYGYVDRADFPYPAVRFQEPGEHINAILQKEKGDWKNLTIEEKKALYRYSYRQTFAEFEAPRGDWKFVVGMIGFAMGTVLWAMMGLKTFVLPPLPKSLSDEAKEAQMRRMINARTNPIEGIASKWDYEKNTWK